MSKDSKTTFNRHLSLFALLFFSVYLFAGCTSTLRGAVKRDTSVTGQAGNMEDTGVHYAGPLYTVGILTFSNKTPSRTIGVGEAATEILRTLLKQAGLEPVLLSNDEMRQQNRLEELQHSGSLKKDAPKGFEPVDLRISGSVTSYSELEEGSDYLIARSKTQVARVQVDYALIDISSGRVLVAESGSGEYRKKTGGVLGLGSRPTTDTSLMDGALMDALSRAMTRMIEKLSKRPFQSRIVMIDGDDIIIKAGTRSRLETGTEMGVYRSGARLVDPDTGRSLGVREKHIGDILLTSHENDKVSDATVKSGVGFKVGDIVRVLKKKTR